jgi:hypothetical protein
MGDLARSAKEGLPIYRIDGGPGLVWAASFGLRGRGTLRVVAADTTGFLASPPEQQAAVQPTTVAAAAETKLSESATIVDQLQAEIKDLTGKIADLETAASAVEVARNEAAQARADAQLAQQAIESATAEKAQLEATISQLQMDKAAAAAKTSWWGKTWPGAIGGLFVVLTAWGIGFVVNRRKTSAPQQSASEPGPKPIELSTQSQKSAQPIEVSAQSQSGAQEIVPHVASPAIAATASEVEVASEAQVGGTPTSALTPVSTPAGEGLDSGGEVPTSQPS